MNLKLTKKRFVSDIRQELEIQEEVMFSKLIKNDEKIDKNKKLNIIYTIILIGIVILILTNTLNDKKENKDVEPFKQQDVEIEAKLGCKTLSKNLETELGDILSKIKGAGEVRVKINYKNTTEKILAKDIDTSSDEMGDKIRKERSEKTILESQTMGQKPVVICEKMPVIDGIFVISEGAGDENVKNEIYDALKALFGIAPHRIKISIKN